MRKSLLWIVLLAAGPAAAAGPASALVGTWRLVSIDSRDESGQQTSRMGPGVIGQLMYDAAGHMSLHLMQPSRKPFATPDRLAGSDAEIRSAFEGYQAYFGRYEVDLAHRTVTHHVVGASFPNWVGTDQARQFEVHGRRLTLWTPAMQARGHTFTSVLVWERE